MEKYMERLTRGLVKSYKICILGLFSAILFLLAVFSAYSTSYIASNASEKTFFVKDNIWLNVGIFVIINVLIVLLRRIPAIKSLVIRINEDESCFLKKRNILLLLGFLLAVLWVLSTQHKPGADQASIQKAVYMLHIKDFSMFAPGGYLSKYPHQLGLVWICYLFSLVFGSYNYIGFQICNAIGVVLIEERLSRIASYFGMKRSGQLAVIILCILFFPLTIYSSFIYGNIMGLSCSLTAIEQEIRYFQTKRFRNCAGAILFIILAVQLKSNYMIFMIGMMLFAGMKMIKEKQIRYIVIPMMLIICYVGSVGTVKHISERISGYPMDGGISSWSWIAMGLQESSRAPGWYNGYNVNLYNDSEYQPEIQAEKAKENIKESVEYFIENKSDARDFFTRKIASQWNNPTFQAYWNVQVRSTAITQPEWSWKLTDAQGTYRSTQFLNVLQFVILAGALASCLFHRDCKEQEERLLLPMIFIGGFVFHLFWEAKCQYTFSYFVLLIPYTVEGVISLTKWLSVCMEDHKRIHPADVEKVLLGTEFPIVIYGLILMIICMILYGGTKIRILQEDTETYLEYLKAETTIPALEEGSVHMKTKAGFVLDLGKEVSENRKEIRLVRNEAEASDQEVEVIHFQGNTWLKFKNDALYMTAEIDPDREYQTIKAMESNLSSQQKWKLKPSENGGFYILYGTDQALTYDEERLLIWISPFSESENQVWYMDVQKEE